MNFAPKYIEECVAAMDALIAKHGDLDHIPFQDCLTITHRLQWDLLNRVLILEQQIENITKQLEETK